MTILSWVGSNLASLYSSYTVIQKLKSEFELIYEILIQYPGNKITFLELPFYSIVKWNSVHNHKEPSSFQEQDRALENRIIQLISEIKKLNKRNQTFSPNFDLYRTSKTKRRGGRQVSRRYFNLELQNVYTAHIVYKEA